MLAMVRTSGAVDPYLEVYDGSGKRISLGFGGLVSRLDSAGPYTALVRDNRNSSTGDYLLSFQRLNNPCNAASLVCGQSVSGRISKVGEFDAYLLQGANLGDTITLAMVRTSGGIDPYLEVYDGSGKRISSGFGGLVSRLDSAGPYTALVRDNRNSATGDYLLTFQRVSNPCNASALACGQSVSGGIGTVGEFDTYLLQGVNPGDTIALSMVRTSGGIDPYLEVYDGSGKRISSGFGGLVSRLESAGPYTALVRDNRNSAIGLYGLSFYRVNSACNAAVLASGQRISGSIATAAEVDAYTVGLRTGAITFCLGTTSPLDACADMYDTQGARQAGCVREFHINPGTNTRLLQKSGRGKGQAALCRFSM
jgi:hypothetical protein